MSNPDNTLLGRCTVALEEAINASDYPAHTTRTRRRGVAAVLEHLAAELVVLNQREPRVSVHEIARRFTLEAAGELSGWAEDDEPTPDPDDVPLDWYDHPSLTAAQRNPSLS